MLLLKTTDRQMYFRVTRVCMCFGGGEARRLACGGGESCGSGVLLVKGLLFKVSAVPHVTIHASVASKEQQDKSVCVCTSVRRA